MNSNIYLTKIPVNLYFRAWKMYSLVTKNITCISLKWFQYWDIFYIYLNSQNGPIVNYSKKLKLNFMLNGTPT